MRPADDVNELPDDPEVDRLLARLDRPVPDVSAREILARARAGRGRRLPWAAAVALTLGVAGAAYAAPGSPLPRWIEAVGRRLGFVSSQAPPPARGFYAGGIAVAPGDSLVIRFERAPAQVAGYARIVIADESEVRVESPSPSTRFTTEPTMLRVEHVTSDTLRVAIPRSSRHVAVELEGRTVFLFRAGQPPATELFADADGAYLVRLTP